MLEDADAHERKEFLRGLEWTNLKSRELFGADFKSATPVQQTELLTAMSSDQPATSADLLGRDFFKAIKSMTITGYYTSEIGMKEELGDDGQVFFAEFKGCDHPEHGAPAKAAEARACRKEELADGRALRRGGRGVGGERRLGGQAAHRGRARAWRCSRRGASSTRRWTITEHKRPYEMPRRGDRYSSRATREDQQQIQSQTAQCNEYTNHLFVKDTECPYTTPKDRPFNWIRGRHVGGKSITWGRQSYRLSDYDLKAASPRRLRRRLAPRLRRARPHYERVERFIGISGQAEGLPQLPDGQFLPPMDLTCGEQHVREGPEGEVRAHPHHRAHARS